MTKPVSEYERALQSGTIKTLGVPTGGFVPPQQSGKTDQTGLPQGTRTTSSSITSDGDNNMGILGGLLGSIGSGLGLFSNQSLPTPPDFTGLAERQSELGLEAARSQTQANRPNEFNPYGSRIWERDPNNPDQWSVYENLSPEQQAIFNTNQQQQQRMANLGLQSTDQVGDLFSSRFQIDGQAPTYSGQDTPLPTYGENRQSVYDAMMGRVNTDITRDRDAKRSQLVAQGIPVGSEAYNREMEQLDRQLTDARQQAEINATDQAGREYSSSLAGRAMGNQELMDLYDTGLQSRRQNISDALLERQTPLNEMNAFRSGSQLQMPSYGAYGMQPFAAPPDLVGAAKSQFSVANDQYNAQVGQNNAMLGGLFNLGSYALSDIRLKHNIKRLGEHKGIPTYEFSYIGSDKRHIGVMAQEAMITRPDAVIEVDGYLAVNYGVL